MRRVRLSCTLLLCLAFSLCKLCAHAQATASVLAAGSTAATTPGAPVAAANPQTPEEFFARARQLSDLETSGIPFHLKATYVASGDAEFTGNGTYEEWWQSKDLWRKEATLGNYKYVAIQNGAVKAASATSTYTPLRVRQITELKIFHIGLPEEKKEDWKLSQTTSDGTMLVDVTKQQPCSPQNKKMLCIEQYVLGQDGALQSYSGGDLVETYSELQPFRNLIFPRTIVSTLRTDPVLTVNISLLEPLKLEGRNLFDTKLIADYHAKPDPVITDAKANSVTPPKLINQSEVKYPESERKQHPKSAVIIAGAIDTTGIVREPYVYLSGGAAFDDAAIRAVRQWKFKPALLDGQPTVIELRILIAFRVW